MSPLQKTDIRSQEEVLRAPRKQSARLIVESHRHRRATRVYCASLTKLNYVDDKREWAAALAPSAADPNHLLV